MRSKAQKCHSLLLIQILISIKTMIHNIFSPKPPSLVYIYKIWISKESVNYWIWLNTDFMLILIGISKDYRICTNMTDNNLWIEPQPTGVFTVIWYNHVHHTHPSEPQQKKLDLTEYKSLIHEFDYRLLHYLTPCEELYHNRYSLSTFHS